MNETKATSTNASRHEISPSAPPSAGASVRPATWTAANVPTLRPSTRAGTASERAASRIGVRNAFDAPIKALPAMNDQISGEAAQTSAAAPKPRYPARTTRAPPSRSPIVPETSCSAANGTM